MQGGVRQSIGWACPIRSTASRSAEPGEGVFRLTRTGPNTVRRSVWSLVVRRWNRPARLRVAIKRRGL